MNINANVSISRRSDDCIYLTIKDTNAVLRFIEVKLTAHDFTMLVTGLSEVPAEHCIVTDLQKVGKIRELQCRRVYCPLKTYSRVAYSQWLTENAQEEGWELDTYLGSQRSVEHDAEGAYLNYTVKRWITVANP